MYVAQIPEGSQDRPSVDILMTWQVPQIPESSQDRDPKESVPMT